MSTATTTRTGPNRWFAALLVHAVMTQITSFVLRPSAAYRAIELGLPAQWLGILSASYAVIPLIIALPSGQAVDRLGEKRVLAVGSVLMAASVGLYIGGGRTIPGLIAATSLLGAGQLLCVMAEQAMVANRVPTGWYDSSFGRYTFATAMGQALGPAFIALFGGSQTVPHTAAIFLAATVPTALLVLAVIPLPSGASPGTGRRRPAAADGTDDKARGAYATLLRTRGLPRALLSSCMVLAAVEILTVYLPALGTERGIASGAIGMLLTIRAAAAMVSRFFLGRLSKALGRRLLLSSSLLISALTLALLAVPMPLGGMVGLMIVFGMTLGACQPLTMSWVAEATPAGLRGRAMSLRLTGNRLGQTFLPALAGLLAAGTGAGGVLVAIAVGLAAAGTAARGMGDSALVTTTTVAGTKDDTESAAAAETGDAPETAAVAQAGPSSQTRTPAPRTTSEPRVAPDTDAQDEPDAPGAHSHTPRP